VEVGAKVYLFGLLLNDSHRVADALLPARALLKAPAGGDRDGWGLGYFEGGEVLFNKRPRHEGGEVDFYELAADIRTQALIGHRRTATVGELREENTHPFRMRSWLFAHSGTVRGFGDFRAKLDAELPAHFERMRPGDTDSERIFHQFMAYLGEKTRTDDPNVKITALIDAMRRTVARLDALASSVGAIDAGPMAIVLTNGRQLLGVTRGLPMVAFARNDTPIPAYEPAALKSVLLVSAPDAHRSSAPGAVNIPDGSIAAVDRNLHFAVHPLGKQAI